MSTCSFNSGHRLNERAQSPIFTVLPFYLFKVLAWILSSVQLFANPWTVHGDFPGKNTTVGCHFLLQGIILIQALNPQSPAMAGGSYMTELPGKPHLMCLLIFKILPMYLLFPQQRNKTGILIQFGVSDR